MSRYLERIAALATGQGPRLRPRPRYRYGDAPAWAPTWLPDAPALITHETSREDAVAGAREQHSTQLAGPKREPSAHERQRAHTLDASATEAQHALRGDAFTVEAAPRLLPLRTSTHGNGDIERDTPFTADRAQMDGAHPAEAPSHRAWSPDESPLAGIEHTHLDGAPRESRGREAARRDARSNEPPTVTVHIGHIDVRAVASPAAAPAPGAITRERAEGPRRPSLDAYLRARDRERQ
ncbi:hypothetical protein [Paraburkholderia pallida]|uniref:Uncharacterized protein n=1 Tax=Paraburkholderia pallida TaxID=2547399 RepID=A0A4P7D2L3_9BURK|nr:hypothetical protein [Paraburkholderia pallida]QBR01447.1 hypothetical protein E1956_30125 [Paraburkholderia pallida]